MDHHRGLRQRLPEGDLRRRARRPSSAPLCHRAHEPGGGPVILTRADDAQLAAAEAANPGPTITRHRPGLATAVGGPRPESRPDRRVTAGTADLPVATECTATLEALGFEPTLHRRLRVAGVHRLLATVDQVVENDVVVVVAGMEGALASVVGGLTGAPVVAVPTSAGYGAALEGVTALLAMLASCAAGITVVGIDNGFGAACAVARTTAVETEP